ncbi:MAG TPA: fibronectin type III domain-containing protein [Candidatus Angelobacter sp.]|nr:fibronectin type III domain-containing protein [Candidatus Angelobacter sp.]
MKTIFLAILLLCITAVAQTGHTPPTSGPQNEPAITIINGPVAEFVSVSSTTIGWTASKSGSMSIKYGSDRNRLDRTAQATPGSSGTSFHVHLDQLAPNTEYFFQVMEDGQPVGGVGTFHTTAPGTPPIRSKAVIPE